MLRKILHSKLHQAIVTAVHPDYSGSLGVDQALLDACGMRSHDAVTIGNCRTGDRFETYVIPLPPGCRRIEVNGAAAHLAEPGDKLIVLHFALADDREYRNFRPTVLILGPDNTIAQTLHYEPA